MSRSAFVASVALAIAANAGAQQRITVDEAWNMELVGRQDLQARSVYQPVVKEQNGRWILYVGHHVGMEKKPKPNNSVTGAAGLHGRSALDVSDPRARR